MDLRVFGRRGLLDLLDAPRTKDGSALPVLPLFRVTQKGDMLNGLVDLPDGIASQMVIASGEVRGVFARRRGSASISHRVYLDSHQIVWAKISRFSDVVFGALHIANCNLAGLVCPRSCGEIGVRVACGTDISTTRRCLEEGTGDTAKALPDSKRRVTLRASNVLLALMRKFHLVVARIDAAIACITRHSHVSFFHSG